MCLLCQDPTPVIIRDPRSRMARFWSKREPANLPVPNFKVTRYIACFIVSVYGVVYFQCLDIVGFNLVGQQQGIEPVKIPSECKGLLQATLVIWNSGKLLIKQKWKVVTVDGEIEI